MLRSQTLRLGFECLKPAFRGKRWFCAPGEALRDDDVCILSFARTPIGSFGGKLAHLTAVQLGAIAVNAAVVRAARLERNLVTDCYLGQVLSAGCGQSPARRAALLADLPDSVRCLTVNKVCASGMKAVTIACDAIRLGHAEVVVAGGMESMSNAPFYLMENEVAVNRSRRPSSGRRSRELGHRTLFDGLLLDGLLDSYTDRDILKSAFRTGASASTNTGETGLEAGQPMGFYADRLASSMGILREEQDNFAVHSYSRAAKATAQQLFAKEIIPIELPAETHGAAPSERFKDTILTASGSASVDSHGAIVGHEHVPLLKTDEELERLVQIDRMPTLTPLFPPVRTAGAKSGSEVSVGGTITAGNASKISDGAAALVLASGRAVRRYNLVPLARILAHADAEQSPERFATTPALALPLALKRAGLSISDLDYLEINEAFACVPIMVLKMLAASHATDANAGDSLRARAASTVGAHGSSPSNAPAGPDHLHALGASGAGAVSPTGVGAGSTFSDIMSSEHVNAWGGAVALGHPLGCSGARIVVTLTNILRSRTARFGAATICNGGGGATALVLERIDIGPDR
ncbi:hypothetical protein CCYA_CCYA14G3818 [Cyanidiococcus yangmingshanensis]|nr:hypothetical protein CCYA_CCYA14G3818 [Cyanidiococcus yangmingshanensis]